MNRNMNTVKSFKDLPKYIEYETSNDVFIYHPTIIKWENEGLTNAYYAMYARYYPRSRKIDSGQVLFYVCAGSFTEVVDKFIIEYNQNAQFIKGRKWIGDNPKIIDLMNNSVDGYLMARNSNKPKL